MNKVPQAQPYKYLEKQTNKQINLQKLFLRNKTRGWLWKQQGLDKKGEGRKNNGIWSIFRFLNLVHVLQVSQKSQDITKNFKPLKNKTHSFISTNWMKVKFVLSDYLASLTYLLRLFPRHPDSGPYSTVWILVITWSESFTLSWVLAVRQMKDDVITFLAAGALLGSTNLYFPMEQCIYRRKSDGVYTRNPKRTWEKLL